MRGRREGCAGETGAGLDQDDESTSEACPHDHYENFFPEFRGQHVRRTIWGGWDLLHSQTIVGASLYADEATPDEVLERMKEFDRDQID